jgi:hypothetical protein
MTTSKTLGKTIYVTKPFTFSTPGTAAVTDPATGKITAHATPGYSKEFTVGEHETTPEMLEHPWLLAGADGAIETEEQKKDRTDQEAINKATADAQGKIATQRAEQAQTKADATAKAANKPAPAPAPSGK